MVFSTGSMSFHISLKGLFPIAAVCVLGLALLLITKRSAEKARGLVRFDPTQPFHLDFGRGDGLNGLETTAIEPGGRTHLCRRKSIEEWERTVVVLGRDQLNDVAKAISRNQLVNLAKLYDGGIYDGTQWVLWIRQDGLQKVVYFDNKFPSSIRRFASELDGILSSAGIEKAEWHPTSGKLYDRELWDSIR